LAGGTGAAAAAVASVVMFIFFAIACKIIKRVVAILLWSRLRGFVIREVT
jgi:hypothetical protein